MIPPKLRDNFKHKFTKQTHPVEKQPNHYAYNRKDSNTPAKAATQLPKPSDCIFRCTHNQISVFALLFSVHLQ